jgi:hypothetical protein
MNEPILWMLWVLIWISFSGYIYFSIQSYQQIKKVPYRFQEHLPFELHDIYFESGQRLASLRWLLLVTIISLFAYWESFFVISTIPLTYGLLMLSTFFLLSLLGVFITRTKRIEPYLLLVTTFFVSAVAMFFLASYIILITPINPWHPFFPWTTLGQGIIQLGMLLNPKLKDWAKLEKVEGTNEKPLYRRPTHFVMAYTQWFTLLNVMIWVLLTQIAYVIG